MSRITGSEAKSMMEAYTNVYSKQDEIIFEQQPTGQNVLSKKTVNGKTIEGSGVGKDFKPQEWSPQARKRYETLKSQDWRSGVGQADPAKLSREAEAARRAQLTRASKPAQPAQSPESAQPPAQPPASAQPPKPAAPVLSKLGGVEGTGVGKDFTAKAWSDTEKQRYTSTAKVSPSVAQPSKMSQWASTNKPMIQKVGTPQQKDILKSAESGGKTPMPTVRPISKDIEDIRAMTTASQLRQKGAVEKPTKPVTVKASYEYDDAYDLVLEYLLSQGHVDTVDEAHYVMLEMNAETIGTIVEAAADQSDKQIDKGVKATYKAQNVLDNQHQGRSKGLNKLPRGEREEKAKRMQGRLKTRRDDLFGERNKREDSKRDKLKKMLGL